MTTKNASTCQRSPGEQQGEIQPRGLRWGGPREAPRDGGHTWQVALTASDSGSGPSHATVLSPSGSAHALPSYLQIVK